MINKKIITILFKVLASVLVLSPVLTNFSAADSINSGSVYSGGLDDISFYGYVLRELSYILLAVFGFTYLIKTKDHIIGFGLFLIFLVFLLIKDVIAFGDLTYSFFGVRIIVIILTYFSAAYMLERSLIRDLRFIEMIIKFSILILIPITLTQLSLMSAFFGATFFGPRTIGFWGNPIIYSMALAAFSIFLYAVKAKNLFFWIFVCLGLAFTTGGRSGLVSITVVALAAWFQNFVWRNVSRKGRGALALIASVLLISGAILLLEVFSMESISGRAGTESGFQNDGRVGILRAQIAKISDQGVVYVLFGRRVGDGTNAVTKVNANIDISDNFFLVIFRSFGLVGLATIFGLVGLWIFPLEFGKVVVASVGLIFAFSQSFFEVHPVGFLFVMSMIIISRTEAYARRMGTHVRNRQTVMNNGLSET